jgi:hypothetical protein
MTVARRQAMRLPRFEDLHVPVITAEHPGDTKIVSRDPSSQKNYYNRGDFPGHNEKDTSSRLEKIATQSVGSVQHSIAA